MRLSETVDRMNSESYLDRFVAEYQQTFIRYMKLKHYCNRIEAAVIGDIVAPPHKVPLEVLRKQQEIMGEYLHILEIRAIAEGIDPAVLGFGGLLD